MGLLDGLRRKIRSRDRMNNPASRLPSETASGQAQPSGRGKDPEPALIPGDQAAVEAARLVAISKKEGWNPIYSIVLRCSTCSSSTSLGCGEAGYYFVHPDRSFRSEGFEELLKCSNCGGTSFLPTVEPKTFREAIEEALLSLETTEQDPGVGFREDGTGRLVVDRSLIRASSFAMLWDRIRDDVDQGGDMNTRFGFDMVNGRYLHKTIRAICHYNYKTQTTVTVLRDSTGSYWYSVER